MANKTEAANDLDVALPDKQKLVSSTLTHEWWSSEMTILSQLAKRLAKELIGRTIKVRWIVAELLPAYYDRDNLELILNASQLPKFSGKPDANTEAWYYNLLVHELTHDVEGCNNHGDPFHAHMQLMAGKMVRLALQKPALFEWMPIVSDRPS